MAQKFEFWCKNQLPGNTSDEAPDHKAMTTKWDAFLSEVNKNKAEQRISLRKTWYRSRNAKDDYKLFFQGEAEAYAVEIKAKAESEEMSLKADAWKDYEKAAQVSMWMEVLPVMAAEVTAPLSQVKRISMVGYSDVDVNMGPSRLISEVMTVIEKIPGSAIAFTGSSPSRFLKLN